LRWCRGGIRPDASDDRAQDAAKTSTTGHRIAGIIIPGPIDRGRSIVRIVVVGTAGAGKTTLAKAIAAALAIPHVELDALHWDPDWRALTRTDPDEFVRRVAAATAGDAWVVDGNYGQVRKLIWRQATHLVWLDYDRPVIMARVIRRTFVRALCRTRLWSGNVEQWRHLLRPSHPIRWAWNTWRRRRNDIAALLAQDEQAHLIVHRLRRPAEANRVLRDLTRATAPAPMMR
jgi:adenylate kinase family enzyme